MIERIHKMKCPYCHAFTPVSIDIEHGVGRQVVLCEIEAAGCDRYFVAFWNTKIEWDCKAIEGEREAYDEYIKRTEPAEGDDI